MTKITERYLLTAYRAVARVGVLRWLAVQANKSRADSDRISKTGEHNSILIDHQETSTRVTQLKRTGYSAGLQLTPEFSNQLLSSLHEQSLIEDRTGRSVPYSQAVKENGSAALRWLNPHITFAPLNKLISDSRLVSVAEQYLGCAPILHSSQIWLLHPPSTEAASGAEYGWHYDLDDFKFLKVFFYLSDTEITGGGAYASRVEP